MHQHRRPKRFIYTRVRWVVTSVHLLAYNWQRHRNRCQELRLGCHKSTQRWCISHLHDSYGCGSLGCGVGDGGDGWTAASPRSEVAAQSSVYSASVSTRGDYHHVHGAVGGASVASYSQRCIINTCGASTSRVFINRARARRERTSKECASTSRSWIVGHVAVGGGRTTDVREPPLGAVACASVCQQSHSQTFIITGS